MIKKRLGNMIYFLIMVLFCGYCAYQSWGYSVAYEQKIISNAEQLELSENLLQQSKKVLEYITFSWYSGYSDEIKQLQQDKQQAEKYQKQADKHTKLFIAVLILMLLLHPFIASKSSLLALLIVINIALVTGWFAPILAIAAYQDMPVLGQTIFQFESKSIVSALEKLYQSKQYLVVFVIFLFTIVMPILKSMLMLLLLYSRNLHFSQKTIKMLKAVGKWSMLDVFVIAIFVTYFSTKAGGSTDATLQIGVFYFVSYVLASMFLTHFIHRTINANQTGN